MTVVMEEATCLMLSIFWETDGPEVVVWRDGLKRDSSGDENGEGLNKRR